MGCSCVANSLIDIVGVPVRLLLVVPDACGVVRGRVRALVMETWNEVGPTDYVFRIKEAKRAILEAWDELDAIQPFCFPSGSVGFIDPEPANPEDIHRFLVNHCRSMENVESEDSEDPCIRVWVNPIVREDHHM